MAGHVLPPEARFRQRFRVQLFYDGWCEFCRQAVATLKRLDLLALLDPVSFREPGVVERFGLDPTRAEARLQARTGPPSVLPGRASTVEGIDAVILIATRLLALWPVVPVLWAAARLGLGQRTYDWIAARRTIIPTGCAEHGGAAERGSQRHPPKGKP